MANGSQAIQGEPAIAIPAAVAAAPTAAKPLESADREDGRGEPRGDIEFTRLRPREDHERYAIEQKAMAKGMDYFWGAVRIQGQPNPRFRELLRAGWRPVRASDFKDISGMEAQVDPRLIELGYMKETKADDPIEDRGLMLLVRPKPLSDVARAEDQRKANRQVDDQMNRLRATSRRAIGDKTQIQRRVERGANLVPDDADLSVED